MKRLRAIELFVRQVDRFIERNRRMCRRVQLFKSIFMSTSHGTKIVYYKQSVFVNQKIYKTRYFSELSARTFLFSEMRYTGFTQTGKSTEKDTLP